MHVCLQDPELYIYKSTEVNKHKRTTHSQYIYIYVVKLKSGPIVALFKVKKWSNFFVFLFFFVFKNLVLPAERRGSLKN